MSIAEQAGADEFHFPRVLQSPQQHRGERRRCES